MDIEFEGFIPVRLQVLAPAKTVVHVERQARPDVDQRQREMNQ